MRNFHKLPLVFESARLRADLDHIQPGDWISHFNKDYYEGDWSGVPLRSPGGNPGKIYPDPATPLHGYAETPVLGRCPYLREVLAAFQCPLKTARLLRLAAGSVIREHRDYNLDFHDGELRVHIPVATNPDLEFYLNGERLILAEGECWYLNFNLPHRVHNRGSSDRVHLVIDCVVNDWVRSLFPPEEVSAPPPAAAQVIFLNRDTPAGRTALDRFHALVLEDLSLQEQLRETEDQALFVSQVVRLGREHGCEFTADDAQAALHAARRAWVERWLI
jgi:hypothetical protein